MKVTDHTHHWPHPSQSLAANHLTLTCGHNAKSTNPQRQTCHLYIYMYMYCWQGNDCMGIIICTSSITFVNKRTFILKVHFSSLQFFYFIDFLSQLKIFNPFCTVSMVHQACFYYGIYIFTYSFGDVRFLMCCHVMVCLTCCWCITGNCFRLIILFHNTQSSDGFLTLPLQRKVWNEAANIYS